MRDRRLRKEADDQREQNKASIQRYFSAYDTGDQNAVLKFVDTNHVYHPPGDEEPWDFTARKDDDAVFFKAFSGINTIIEDQIAGVYSESFYRQYEPLMDGIIDFKTEEKEGKIENNLRIRAMQGKKFDSRWHHLELQDNGEVIIVG